MCKKLFLLALVLCVAGQASAGLVAYYDFASASTKGEVSNVASGANVTGSAAPSAYLAGAGVITSGALDVGAAIVGTPGGYIGNGTAGDGAKVADSTAFDFTNAVTLTANVYIDDTYLEPWFGGWVTGHWEYSWGQVVQKGSNGGSWRMERNVNTMSGGPVIGGSAHEVNSGAVIDPTYSGATGGSHSTWGWHHVAMTYDGSTVTTWLDGVAGGTIAQTGAMDIANTFDVTIGYGGETNNLQWIGQIDDVSIWGDAVVTSVGMGKLSAGTLNPNQLVYGTDWIPEPATICLLGLGGLALLRRKR